MNITEGLIFTFVVYALIAAWILIKNAKGGHYTYEKPEKETKNVVDDLFDDTFNWLARIFRPHKGRNIIYIPYYLNNRITMLTDEEEALYKKKLERLFTVYFDCSKVEFGNNSKGPFSTLIAYY